MDGADDAGKLLRTDADQFNRWQAANSFATRSLVDMVSVLAQGKSSARGTRYAKALGEGEVAVLEVRDPGLEGRHDQVDGPRDLLALLHQIAAIAFVADQAFVTIAQLVL